MRINWILLLICALFSQLTIAQRTLLHCGKLIDGTSENVATQMTVIVEGKIIAGVEKGYTKPATGDKVIDLKSKTVMAGLMDMHVHIEGESSPTRYLERFTLNDADRALRATVYAKRTLMAGFTTVRDLGGSTRKRNSLLTVNVLRI